MKIKKIKIDRSNTKDFKFFSLWYGRTRILYLNWFCGLTIGFFDYKN